MVQMAVDEPAEAPLEGEAYFRSLIERVSDLVQGIDPDGLVC